MIIFQKLFITSIHEDDESSRPELPDIKYIVYHTKQDIHSTIMDSLMCTEFKHVYEELVKDPRCYMIWICGEEWFSTKRSEDPGLAIESKLKSLSNSRIDKKSETYWVNVLKEPKNYESQWKNLSLPKDEKQDAYCVINMMQIELWNV